MNDGNLFFLFNSSWKHKKGTRFPRGGSLSPLGAYTCGSQPFLYFPQESSAFRFILLVTNNRRPQSTNMYGKHKDPNN